MLQMNREKRFRKRRLSLSGFLLGLMVVLAALVPTARAIAATDNLPDLGLDHYDFLTVDKTTMPGHNLLRFTSRLINVGSGAFEIRGARPNTSSTVSVIQRIYNSAGSFRDVRTSATMVYDTSDGHNHWHVKNLVAYDLIRADSGAKIATSSKVGFCFNDNTVYDLELPGASANPVYGPAPNFICAGGNPNALNVLMGLSVGWADEYGWSLPWQWVDITGIAAGNYSLRGHVDVNHLFVQSNAGNDCAYANLQIAAGGSSIHIVSTPDGLQACK
jgi:hypothetical protein